MRDAFEAGVVTDTGPPAGGITGVVPAAGGLAGGVPAAAAGAGPEAGDITGVGPAAGCMTAPHGSMIVFNNMRNGYLSHLVCQWKVDLQLQLLAAQEGRIQQNDVKVAELAARVGFMGGPGVSVSQMAVMGPQAVAAPQLILVGAEPPGYAFMGQNFNLVIWGSPDNVQATITNKGDNSDLPRVH